MGDYHCGVSPQHEISAVAARSGEWLALGNDPQFRVEWPGADILPAGWYVMRFELDVLEGPLDRPCLYPDYGEGISEGLRLDLTIERAADSKRCESIVCFPRPLHGLRLDPSQGPCRFQLRAVALRHYSRPMAAWWMMQRVLARQGGGKLTFAKSLRAGAALASGFARQCWMHGPRNAGTWLYERWGDLLDRPELRYLDWVRSSDLISEADRVAMRQQFSAWISPPLFSVVMPVYNPPERWLRRCLDSVLAQTYPHWELCVADDASPASHVRRVLDEYTARDARIRVVHRESNGHICAASNSALALARGDYVALLDHDDELAEHALFTVAATVRRQPQARLLYSDEDKIDEQGRRFDPYFKPAFSIELFRGHNMISHLGVYERRLLQELDGFRAGLEGSQDYDLALRAVERLRADEIVHIPQVLYHWRAISGSTALGPQEKDYAHVAARRAIGEHLQRIGLDGEIFSLNPYIGNWRVKLKPARNPRVSIIVPTRNRLDYLQRCTDSIVRHTRYDDYEIVVVDNGSDEADVLAFLHALEAEGVARVLRFDEPFNFARINNFAAAHCDGEILLFLNNDTEIRSEDWLAELVSHASQADIGAAGGLLCYPDGRIQHAGIVLGLGADRVAGHAYHFRMRGYPGDKCRALLVQSLSAVTAACMALERAKFEAVGGFDERLAVAFNDVDLCLRLNARGWRTVWTPNIDVVHYESVTRGSDLTPERRAAYASECAFMRERWPQLLDDPYYHPALSLDHNDSLHYVPSRRARPWQTGA